jgi:uncharacterized phage-associated protein
MCIKYRFDVEKTIEVILYIADRIPNTYRALKVLYFADREHLDRYGRLICGDSYVAMKLGPVPSGAYDLVKSARGDGWSWPISVSDSFTVQDDNKTIVPLRKVNLDLLSESDIECLNVSIEKYGHLSISDLIKISHDSAYNAADPNDYIPLEEIVKSLPSKVELLEYLQDN